MLVALPKQAEKKLIAVVFVAHLPHPTPPTLHDLPCPSGDLQQKLSEFDQFQSFNGAGMSVVKTVPSTATGFPGKILPNPITFTSSHHARQAPVSPHNLCVATTCSTYTRGSAEKP